MNKLILFGAGGHAKSCIDIILQQKKYRIVSIIEKTNSKEKLLYNYKIINDQNYKNLRKVAKYAAIGIGQISNNKLRKNLFLELKKNNFLMPNFFSSRSYVSKLASISEGIFVMNMAVINANSLIKPNCIINTGAIIEHDVVVEENCHIAPGAIICGGANIGSGSFIGAGTIVHQNSKIKKNSIISAGSIIKK